MMQFPCRCGESNTVELTPSLCERMRIIGSVTHKCECGKRYLICPAVDGVEVHECKDKGA